METSRAVLEESIFGQTGAANEVATTRYTPVPSGWTGNTSTYVSRTGTTSGHNTGPNTLQKVMAGDLINATVQYYHQGAAGGNNTNFLNTVLSSLTPAISGGSATSNLVKTNATNITTQLGGVNGFVNAVQPNGSNPAGNTPQAFLTIIFFDERFNFIAAADGGVAQQQVLATVGSNGSSLTLANIKAPKNGYAYVYLSNQSNNDVYFDDLLVGATQGNIAEENHYYAYGLKIAMLSSKKLGDVYEGTLKNNYLYNDKELFDDADLNWYDYGFRNYDPQIGRFPQLDPLTFSYPFLTPYQYASCEPIRNTDLDGLEGKIAQGLASIGGEVLTEVAEHGGAVKELSNVILKGFPQLSAAVRASKAGLSAAKISLVLMNATNTINNLVTTQSVGKMANRQVNTDYLGGPTFNLKLSQTTGTYNMQTKEIDPGKIFDFAGDMLEHSEKASSFFDNTELEKMSKTGGALVTGLKLTYHFSKKDYGGLVKDGIEIGISKSPLAPYYYSYKLFDAIANSRTMLARVYMGLYGEFQYYQALRKELPEKKQNYGNGAYRRYSRRLEKLHETLKNLEEKWLRKYGDK